MTITETDLDLRRYTHRGMTDYQERRMIELIQNGRFDIMPTAKISDRAREYLIDLDGYRWRIVYVKQHRRKNGTTVPGRIRSCTSRLPI